MKVIIDAGSTKADWAFLQESRIIRKSTIGFNPVASSGQAFMADYLADPIIPTTPIQDIYFYGAGCSTQTAITKTQTILQELFPGSNIHIYTDLLGAALATSNGQPAIICLLGTGSNSCLFNGSSVIDQIPNLGYLLGDEGSGFAIGKAVLKAYFYREFSNDLNLRFQDQYQLSRDQLIQKVYSANTPNRVVADFARFAVEYKDHPDIKKLVKTIFEEFIQKHVTKYAATSSVPVHFVGSIAYIFRSRIREILTRHHLKPGTFLRKPIDGLITYHQ